MFFLFNCLIKFNEYSTLSNDSGNFKPNIIYELILVLKL